MSDNTRDAIGLTSAEDGDVFGALRFVEFMHREMVALCANDELPGVISDRFRSASRDMERLAAYIEGYAAAHQFTMPPHADVATDDDAK